MQRGKIMVTPFAATTEEGRQCGFCFLQPSAAVITCPAMAGDRENYLTPVAR